MLNNSNSNAHSGGIGFLGALSVPFIGLKLTNHIAWGWKQVLATLWIPIALALAFVLLIAVLRGVIQ